MHNTLESQRWFPYVAWALVVAFAAFTANLALSMQREIDQIGETTDRIERALIDANMMSDEEVVPGMEVDAASETVVE